MHSTLLLSSLFFFFNDTATTEIYTLSLHDALPICTRFWPSVCSSPFPWSFPGLSRSEEHTSELQSPCNLVCRLLLEKKTRHIHLGHVPPGQRARQGACAVGPLRLPSVLRSDHRIQEFFFFNDTATTEIYPLSLHDALPISSISSARFSTCPQIRPKSSSTAMIDRKSTRLNSSHLVISYAVFCLKKHRQ